MNDDVGKYLLILGLLAAAATMGWHVNQHKMLTDKTFLQKHVSKLEEGDKHAFFKNAREVREDVL